LGQLIIVSNRVAVPEKNAKTRAGGLEVAVKAALKHKTCTWFGWSGKVVAQTKIATQTVVHDKITYGRSCTTGSISPSSRAGI